MTSATVAAILKSLQTVDGSSLSNRDRAALLDGLWQGVNRFGSPMDVIIRMGWLESSLTSAVRTVADLDLFTKWQQSGKQGATAADLAPLVNCEEELLERLLRHLAAAHLLGNPRPAIYEQTPFTRSFIGEESTTAAATRFMGEVSLPAFTAMPAYLKKTGFKSPSDVSDNPWTSVLSKPETFFDYIGSRPSVSSDFMKLMVGKNQLLTPWVDVFPAEQLLVGDDKDADVPLLVDVGGNRGHDISMFVGRFKPAPGRAILQDLDDVCKQAVVDPAVRIMPHDFFTPQPIKGARAYFMHMILHDWTDDQCKEILQHLRAAMDPATSRLLLNELVMLDEGNQPLGPTADLSMMMNFGSKERTEKNWKELLKSAGLKIVKIYQVPGTVDAVIEAVVA